MKHLHLSDLGGGNTFYGKGGTSGIVHMLCILTECSTEHERVCSRRTDPWELLA